MRAKINHGQRGKSIDKLAKSYDFEHPSQFYAYIIESYENGHYDQVIELFNEMKENYQKSFLLNVAGMDAFGDKVHDLIIKNL